MRISLAVHGDPVSSRASQSALRFCEAAVARGHDLYRVFFYHDGVNNGSRLTTPPQDDRHIQQRWSELAEQHNLDLVLCVAACQRRGLVDADEKKRHGKDADNIADGFRISGLGQLIEASVEADRVVSFGD